MPSVLGFVSHGGKHSENVTRLLMELGKETDRSAAIICATVVDVALTQGLVRFLHSNKKITDKLFEPSNALGSFSAKIDLGRLVGLYGDEAHRDLHTMRNIRNAFAHSLEIHDFKSQQIRDLAKNFKIVERHTHDVSNKKRPKVWVIGLEKREDALDDPRDRYLLTASVMTVGLALAESAQMPQPLF